MLNVIAVMGRLVADPELRKTPNGVSTTTFTIACDRSYVKPGAERQTDFLDVVAWRNSAEFACKYFRKGQLVAVNGSLQTRTYEDKNGNKRKVYEIVADNLHFADSKPSGQGGYSGGGSQSAGSSMASAPSVAASDADVEDFIAIDDSSDLPF